jgi:Protein of unknown function (DUF4232)
MTRYGHIGWRLVAVVAFAGTAALAVVLTRAPTATQVTSTSNISCPTSGLQSWIGLGMAEATATPGAGGTNSSTQTSSSTYYTLEFTNISHRTCSLYGYPDVSAYTDSQVTGSQMTSTPPAASAAARDTSVAPHQVMLQPGATAHSILQVTVPSGVKPAGCVRVIAQELRVALPDQGRAAYLPVHIPVCSGKGHPSLSVQAIQARPGIPGYTMP